MKKVNYGIHSRSLEILKAKKKMVAAAGDYRIVVYWRIFNLWWW